ncbi:hypothetical protein GLYMA_18G036500v4 [Glycine max]|uniref:Uncharacterized protein n=1 Tax=Glycine max TaxID=3847 RepID=A0A0R0F710_SOYBN|nr:hypothetical protein GYH30_048928 [Glycine max]KAH1153054.1 hypothetical protein GYH30_048928 [Glycine max]KAH1196692.1 hypothetical protein GmHk_18G050656 [Glycine max]KRG97876.1 hypothetical protein GLYMA_18G036500v4 [Glycine max]KRG97877.1 hypothetical protein GLYMA_18G036500v4 [Glycine max]
MNITLKLPISPATFFLPIPHLRRRHLPLHVPHHLPHTGPLFRRLRGTQQPHLHHQQSLHLIKHPTQPTVHHRQHVPHAPPLPHPLHQHKLLRLRLHLNRPPPTHHLQHQRPERINIRTRRWFPRPCELRRKIPQRSHHTCGARVRTVLVKLGQTKITQPSVHLVVQQNIPRFHVSVNHRLLPLLVQIN